MTEIRSQILKSRSLPGEVAEANVDFYRGTAYRYDLYESCVFDSFFQQMLIDDLNRITASFEHVVTQPKALDCGGGTGNIAVKLLERGWSVTVVDVSPEMLGILSQKCEARRLSPWIVNGAIETYLAERSESYDLICFGSVLHHLYSYLSVVSMAADRVRPGGFFYSNFDPVITRRPFLAHVVTSIDTLAAKVLYDRADVFPGILRRMKKVVSKPSPLHRRRVASAGDIAEYHARTGIDDCQIGHALVEKGFAILEHSRYGAGRTLPIRRLNSFWRISECCKIWARRDP